MFNMHPTFKPIFEASCSSDIRKHPHMQQVGLSKIIPAKDTWYPSIDEVYEGNKYTDPDATYISGKVEVFLKPSYTGIKYANKFCVEKWQWRVSVWGGDDTGAEYIFDNKKDAFAIYEALDECPRRFDLLFLWGFLGI